MFIPFAIVNYILWLIDSSHPKPALGGPVFLILLLSFTILWLIFGEIRTKMIKVIIDDQSISVSRFAGLAPKRKYLFSEISGCKTSFLQSSVGGNEYLYVMQDQKKVIKISDFYHKNYQELKEQVKLKTVDLGFEKFSYMDELKETFN